MPIVPGVMQWLECEGYAWMLQGQRSGYSGRRSRVSCMTRDAFHVRNQHHSLHKVTNITDSTCIKVIGCLLLMVL
jgi:hypothetical protein